jgi:hypothetical protein
MWNDLHVFFLFYGWCYAPPRANGLLLLLGSSRPHAGCGFAFLVLHWLDACSNTARYYAAAGLFASYYRYAGGMSIHVNSRRQVRLSCSWALPSTLPPVAPLYAGGLWREREPATIPRLSMAD